MQTLQAVTEKDEYKPFDVKLSEELIVCISQYKTVDYTEKAIRALKEDGIKFTTLLLFDGTSEEDINKIKSLADISIHLQKRANSLPHIWNMMFALAKLTNAKYLFWQGSDMIMRSGGLRSMLSQIKYKDYDCVSPIKIDKDEEKFKNYVALSDKEIKCAGFNDSACMFKTKILDYRCFDEIYAPYQFETSALAYELWRNNAKMCIDTSAVMLHYCNKDIEHSPSERDYGSRTWDMKRDYFLKNADDKKKWFCEKSIMNAASANIYGFPIHIYET
jgi:hypothetical protein